MTIEKLYHQVELKKLEKLTKRKLLKGFFKKIFQEKCRENLSRTNRNNELFSFKQLVEYSINKFNRYGSESESDDCNGKDSTVQNNKITNNQYQKKTNFSNGNN